jgi:hypothetical protein
MTDRNIQDTLNERQHDQVRASVTHTHATHSQTNTTTPLTHTHTSQPAVLVERATLPSSGLRERERMRDGRAIKVLGKGRKGEKGKDEA